MSRFSRTEGRWHGRTGGGGRVQQGTPDNREWRTELPNGIVRVDMGEPIKALPCEPQPMAIKRIDSPAPPSPSSADLCISDPTFTEMLPRDMRQPQRPRSAFTRD